MISRAKEFIEMEAVGGIHEPGDRMKGATTVFPCVLEQLKLHIVPGRAIVGTNGLAGKLERLDLAGELSDHIR